MSDLTWRFNVNARKGKQYEMKVLVQGHLFWNPHQLCNRILVFCLPDNFNICRLLTWECICTIHPTWSDIAQPLLRTRKCEHFGLLNLKTTLLVVGLLFLQTCSVLHLHTRLSNMVPAPAVFWSVCLRVWLWQQKTVFSSLFVYSCNGHAKLGNSNKMRNRKRSSMKEVWEMRAVFVPMSSKIRPNVPAVALCCCGDNCMWVNKKRVKEMLHNTLRISNSSPKTRHLNQLFIWKALGLNEKKTCWKAVCNSAGSLFPRHSPNLISLLHDAHSSMKITTQDSKNTL